MLGASHLVSRSTTDRSMSSISSPTRDWPVKAFASVNATKLGARHGRAREPHGPVGKVARGDRPRLQHRHLTMPRVALDALEGGLDGFRRPLQHPGRSSPSLNSSPPVTPARALFAREAVRIAWTSVAKTSDAPEMTFRLQ